MNEARDKRIVALALERGLVTPELIEAARTLQAESDTTPPPSILQILLQQGHLTRDKVVELVSTQHVPDLERCELAKELGSGVLGTACAVRNEADGKYYIIKVLHPSVARDAALVEQIRRDAAIAARIDHPNVVRIFGMGEKLDDTFVVSEYIDGATLDQLLEAKGKLEIQETLSVALACATALDLGQERGLRHGAISPANLLVARDGSVKLADLGLTKPPIAEVSLSKTGEGVRRPHCLAPEHLDREPRLDTRSDLFSLGCVLYRGLTGQQPFQGDTTAEVTFAIRDGEFRPVCDVAPDVPRGLAAMVEKLLQPDPARRYQTPGELLDDLEAVKAGKVPEAERAAIAEARDAKAREPEAGPEPEPAPSRRWLWAAAAVAAVALLAGGAWLAARRPKAATPPPAGEEAEPETTDPVLLARRGREEIEKVAQTAAIEKVKDADKKVALIQDTIGKLEDIKRKYKDTAAAREAGKRLVPLQAEALFQTAWAYAREHKGGVAEIAKRYRAVVEKFPDTAAGLKAERELDKLEGLDRKKLQRELAEVRKRVAKLVAKERFGDALGQYDAMLAKAASEATKQQVLQEKIAITTKAEQAYEKLHELAQEKVRGRYFEGARALYARVVERFGVEPYVGRAKGEIAVIEPLLEGAGKRRTEAIDAAKYEWFLTRLEPSLAAARGWQLVKARAEAEKLRPELRTAKIEGYLDDYLADVGLLRGLKRQVIRRLNDRGREVLGKDFSLGKVGGRFDREWLKAKVLSADDEKVVLRYGQVDVHRAWDKFPPDELDRLGKLPFEPNDPQGRLLRAVHCLYAGLKKTATSELNAAKAGGVAIEPYLRRLELVRSADEAAQPTETQQEEASRLLIEAKRFMTQRDWDRALYRLALLRQRHAKKTYDVSANLADINRRIVECKKHVEKLEMETDLALGRRVVLTRDSLFGEWQKRFGTWSIDKGVVRGEVVVDPKAKGEGGGDHDAECLFSLTHPPTYELRVTVRVVKGMGALIRLAGKARPNLGFWVHATDPKLVGILHAYKGDEKPAEHTKRPFAFKPGEWYEIRAFVNPAAVEVRIGNTYRLHTANKLPPDPKGILTYGFLVNPRSAAEFRDFSVRVLKEQ